MPWINFTRTRVHPADVGLVLDILGDEASLSPIRDARGFCELFLVESTEVPGEMISITVWESAEDGQAYLASPECRAVTERIQEYLVRPPERGYYQVLLHANLESEQYTA